MRSSAFVRASRPRGAVNSLQGVHARALARGLATDVTDSSFQAQVADETRPIVLDAHAAWCGPCRTLAPILESVEKDFPTVKLCKLDVDAEQRVASALEVTQLPSLYLIHKGKVVEPVTIGLQSKASVEELFKRAAALAE